MKNVVKDLRGAPGAEVFRGGQGGGYFGRGEVQQEVVYKFQLLWAQNILLNHVGKASQAFCHLEERHF